jgi:hypothetical protein
LGPAHPASVRSQAPAKVSLVPPQAVGRMAFPVVPDLFGRIELWGIRRELLQMEPRVSLADRLDGRPSMNGTAVPEEDDMAAQMPQEHAAEVRHIHGLEVVRLEADIQTHVLALWGHGKRGQRRDPVMLVIVADDGGVPLRRPGVAARRYEPTATFIQESEVRPQAAGFFFIAGHWSRCQWTMACSSRGRARRSGT